MLLAFSFSVTAASPFACNKSTRFTGRTPSSNAIASHSGRLQLLSRVERARGHDAGGCHVSCKAQLILPSSWTLRAMLGVPARRWIRDLQGFEIETVSAGKQRKPCATPTFLRPSNLPLDPRSSDGSGQQPHAFGSQQESACATPDGARRRSSCLEAKPGASEQLIDIGARR